MIRNRTGLMIIAVLAGLVLALLSAGCYQPDASTAAGRGKALAVSYGCAACHDMPNMPTAGLVGPPLRGIARRAYLAGTFSNTPENMIRWIRSPRQLDPDTLMPELGVSQEDGRDLAAFLYTLP